jgi:hypothetical protein
MIILVHEAKAWPWFQVMTMRKKSAWEILQHRAKARINAEQKKLDVLKIDAPGVEDAQANGKHK